MTHYRKNFVYYVTPCPLNIQINTQQANVCPKTNDYH